MSKLSKQEAQTRLAKLRDLINDYRYQYNVLDKSIMSEAAADSLKHELTQLEADYPELITPDSPSQRVAGEPLPGFKAVKHQNRMLSLNDVFNETEVGDWVKRMAKLLPTSTKLEFFMDVKMDGLACSLIYENGKLVRAVTRGDGTTGEDVTMNVRTIDSVPLVLRKDDANLTFLQGITEVRGEIVMYKNDFAALNKQRAEAGLPLFANPRNTAAGTIRQLDPKLVGARPLQYHAYDLLRQDINDVTTNEFAYKSLRQLGFRSNSVAKKAGSVKEVMQFVQNWETERHKLPFHTDGVVIKLNDRRIFDRLGVVGKAPRGAVAFKYPAEEATTIVKDIVLSIGRTGAATPIAVFDPVVVANTTVQHASLHNADEIAKKDIRVGDTVIIFKAGDIIPQVLKVLPKLRPKNARSFNYEAELKRQYPELSFERPAGEAVYRLIGATGPLLLKKALEHFASKGALDIEGLGEKNVVALVDADLVKDLADIFQLTYDQILSLERFAEISASKLVKAIADKKRPPLERFVYGIGIRHVGAQTAVDLSEAFGSIQKLKHATVDELNNIEGIGTVVAESIMAWFVDEENQALLSKFEALGVEPFYESSANGPLSGQSFVITGTLETMGREQAAERIRSLGGTFQSSVGKDTSFLVVGANVGNSKLQKATKLGVKQIDEAALIKILDQ